MKKQKNLSKKRLVLVILPLVVLIIGGFITYQKMHRDNSDKDTPEQFINFGPPTEEEQKAGDEKKEELANDAVTQTQQSDGESKTASVIITDAGQYDDVIEVRAFISDHYQDGTCTIAFTKGSSVITKDTPAYRDVSTTICTNPLFKRSDFPSGGEWQVVVSYKSADASGKSAAQTVTIN